MLAMIGMKYGYKLTGATINGYHCEFDFTRTPWRSVKSGKIASYGWHRKREVRPDFGSYYQNYVKYIYYALFFRYKLFSNNLN